MSIPAYQAWASAPSIDPGASAGRVIVPGDGAGNPSVRLVVRLLHIQRIHVDDSTGSTTAPYAWIDITDTVQSLDCTRGATDGAESRWPIGTLRLGVDGQAFAAINAEPFISGWPLLDPANGDAGFGLGSVIQWGFRSSDPALGWLPKFTGYIFGIREVDAPPYKGRPMTIDAYDASYQLASANDFTAATTADNTAASSVLTTWLTAIKWRFGVSVSAATRGLPPVALIGNGLQLCHQIADSSGCRIKVNGAGVLVAEPWAVAGTSAFSVGDDSASDLRATFELRLDQNRANGALRAFTPSGVSSTVNTTDWNLRGRMFQGQIAGGDWPKRGILARNTSDLNALVADAEPRYRKPWGITSAAVDTVHPVNGGPAWRKLILAATSSVVMVQRQRAGVTAIVGDHAVMGMTWQIRPTTPTWTAETVSTAELARLSPAGRMLCTFHLKDQTEL